MATLEKIRSKAGLLVGVVGFALVAFILGDFLNSGSTFWRQSQETVIEIDGEEIKIQDYQKRLDERENMQKMQMQTQSIPEEGMIQIREEVYRSIVREKVLDREAEKIGLTVTDAEIFELLAGDTPTSMLRPFFTDPQTGAFNKVEAAEFVSKAEANDPTLPAEIRDYYNYIKRMARYTCLEEKFNALLTKSLCANQVDAKVAYENNKPVADFAYVMQPYTVVADSLVSVSDEEVRKLYDSRKEFMKQEEERKADLLIVNIVPSEADFAAVNESISEIKSEFVAASDVADIADIVNDNSDIPYADAFVSASALDPDARNFATTALSVGDVMGPMLKNNTYRMMKLVDKKVAPDSVSVMALPVANLNDPRATEIADSLLAVLKGGASFEQVYRDFVKNPEAKVEASWFTESTALQGGGMEFKNTIFSTPVNQVVKLNVGNMALLFKVVEKSANVPLYKIADIVINVNPSSSTYSNLYNELNKFVTNNTNNKAFADTASAAGYTVVPGVSIFAASPTVYNVKSSRPVVRWVFENEPGDISSIFECDNAFIVANVKSVTEKGYRPFEQVKDVLKQELIRQKKGEMIAADMKAMNLSSLDQYAEKLNRKVDSVQFVTFSTQRLSGVGVEPKLNAAATLLPTDKVSDPIAGNSGVYVLDIYKRTESSAPFDAKAEMKKIESALPYAFIYQVNRVLNEKSEIEDNRLRFY